MENELVNNYLTAAIDALNKVVTSDVSPRLASKVVRFRQILSNYAATNGKGKGTQTAIEFEENAENAAAKIANNATENAANGEGAKTV
jgi:hypothetical protein